MNLKNRFDNLLKAMAFGEAAALKSADDVHNLSKHGKTDRQPDQKRVRPKAAAAIERRQR